MNKTKTNAVKKHEFPTIEELKAIPEFAHLTDEEAQEALFTLQQLAKITYDLWLKERAKTENPDDKSIMNKCNYPDFPDGSKKSKS